MEIKNTLNGVADSYGTKLNSINKDKVEAGSKEGQIVQPGRSGDRISLSNEAKLRLAAQQTITNTPDTRAEQVAALKASVNDGTYTVDAKELAKKLLVFEKELAKSLSDNGE